EFARQQGDVLVVGVNSDESVRRIKGRGRPVVAQEDRTRLLAALEAVDYVVVFDEDRVDRLVSEVRPDVLVKGAQWGREVHGREIVERDGGRVILAPMREGRSTTAIIEKIRKMV
ncbi:MAG: adenylyltransferase/cytidyltransferase family protein, partial [Kiritimatiellae bacterium]|nr:adenylyltransferase/cytidyltransferase family protein [Kiritimatiellia bacterium]